MSLPWVRYAALPLILVLAACGVPDGGRPPFAGDGRPLVLATFTVLAVLMLRRRDLLLTLLSLAAVAGLQSVGIILVVAMLVTPGATAYLLTDRFDRMMGLAVVSAVSATVIGVLVSYWLEASTAGCIVVQTLQFVLVMLLAPRHGLLAQRRRHQQAARRPPT